MSAYLRVTYADGSEGEFELKHGSNVIGKVLLSPLLFFAPLQSPLRLPHR